MRGGSVFKRIHLVKSILRSVALLMLLWISPLQAMEDPTRPPTGKATSSYVGAPKSHAVRWTLHSTLVSSERRTAVINDRVVSQGDRINGATVVSIQPSSVRLRNKGREMTLVMLKKKIKSLSRETSLSQGK